MDYNFFDSGRLALPASVAVILLVVASAMRQPPARFGIGRTATKAGIAARGPDMGGYHLNPIVAWRIRGDGTVLFRPENWK
jgi:hypothetical protein